MMQRDEDDAAWMDDRDRNNWKLPRPAALPWRVWGIRHARFVWHLWRVEHRARLLSGVGIGVPVIAPYDRWVLHAIMRGWV